MGELLCLELLDRTAPTAGTAPSAARATTATSAEATPTGTSSAGGSASGGTARTATRTATAETAARRGGSGPLTGEAAARARATGAPTRACRSAARSGHSRGVATSGRGRDRLARLGDRWTGPARGLLATRPGGWRAALSGRRRALRSTATRRGGRRRPGQGDTRTADAGRWRGGGLLPAEVLRWWRCRTRRQWTGAGTSLAPTSRSCAPRSRARRRPRRSSRSVARGGPPTLRAGARGSRRRGTGAIGRNGGALRGALRGGAPCRGGGRSRGGRDRGGRDRAGRSRGGRDRAGRDWAGRERGGRCRDVGRRECRLWHARSRGDWRVARSGRSYDLIGTRAARSAAHDVSAAGALRAAGSGGDRLSGRSRTRSLARRFGGGGTRAGLRGSGRLRRAG
jgi:hypothetical protein